MSRCRSLIMVFSLCIGMLSGQNAFAFRCGSGLVTEGESKISVLRKCGEPSWVDRWSEESIELPDTDFEHRISRINERWIYNPGPTQFLRIVTFRDSKVFAIETGSRGFTVVPGMQRCDLDTFSLGATSAEIVAQCGEPNLKEQRYETITHKIAGGRKQIRVTVDEWTFNLGPSRFMRTLTFRNGNLVDIKTKERGFK